MKKLTTLLVAFFCCLFVGAQPLVRTSRPYSNHHTHRLPGVNERRLARLEKMREANLALRRQHGPLRVNAQPETKRGLVLLVEFSDEKMKSDAAAQWNSRFNQQGYSQYNHIGSVRDYFIEQSYGLLTIDFDIVGPLTLSNSRSYYGTSPNSRLSDRAAEMVIEALKLANPQVNYADYDWDGDREVDQVYVIFAGITKNNTQGYIWPHEWSLSDAQYYGCGSGYQMMDGVYINTFAVSNELANTTTLEGIGTACHEFSHCLGYPDFYDTSYSGGTAAQFWDVLDGGSYNGPQTIGEVPSPYTAYERSTAGWIDLIPLTAPCRVKDMPAINEEGTAYIIKNTGNANEYYILENRQQRTFGRYNGGHGLMVWHIDYSKSAWNNNRVNADKSHQRMTFLPADGKVGDLQGSDYEGYYYNVTAQDEAGDPYPGSKKVTSVEQLTWFTSERGGTKNHQHLIHDIREADGKISFTYGDYIALPTPELAAPTDITADSFRANWMPVEGATSYTLQVETQSGGDGIALVFAEDFSGFTEAGDGKQIGSSIVDKYAKSSGWSASYLFGTSDTFVRVGHTRTTGYLTTPAIDNKEGMLIVEFDAAYYNEKSISAVVTVLNGTQTVATDTVPLTATQATYRCTFADVPSGCKVKFSTPGAGKPFYLYSIKVMDTSGAEGRTVTYTGITSTSQVIELLYAETCYYRVQAVCDDGPSEWSEWLDVDIASPVGEVPTALSLEGRDEVFDLSGRRLQRVPQRGLYIRNGKAYLAR